MKRFYLLPAVLLILCSFYPKSYSQDLVSPSNADVNVVSSLSTGPTWMNNAVVETSGSSALYAVTWDDNTNPISFVVSDGTSVTSQTIAGPGAGYTLGHPDIILGTDGSSFYAAVVYTAGHIVGGLPVTNIFLEVYTITAGPTITATCSGAKQISTSGKVRNAHIDAITNPLTSPYTSDNFVIAWEDMACKCTSTFGAKACKWSFSNIVSSSCNTANITYSGCINQTPSDGQMVDIAAIQYGNAMSFDNMAYLTYYDPTTSHLYTNTWDISTGAIGGNTTVATGNIQFPRIDADDEGMAGDEMIVYRRFNGSNWQAYTWDPLNSVCITAPYNYTNAVDIVSPVITNHADAGAHYFFPAYYVPGSSCCTENIFAQKMLYNGTMHLDILGNVDYFQVPTTTTYLYSTVANTNDYYHYTSYSTGEMFTCWYNTNGSIDCKITGFGTGLFKPTDVIAMKKADNLQIFPNPASDELTLKQGALKASEYSICDILGHSLLKGKITGDDDNIQINMLSKGMYILNVKLENGSNQILKFAKN